MTTDRRSEPAADAVPAACGARHRRVAAALRGWDELGRGSDLRVVEAEVWTVELPFRRPVATAAGTHSRRPLVLVRLECAGADGTVNGWGECAALADTTYDAEDTDSAAHTLVDHLLPGLLAGGPLPGPAAMDPQGVDRRMTPLAMAAMEQAVADAHLRATGRSLAELFGVAGDRVPVGAVVGIQADPDALVAAVGELVAAGYARVKMKVEPGTAVDHVAAVRAAHPRLRLQGDANCSYAGYDPPHRPGTAVRPAAADPTPAAVDSLAALDPFGLTCLEQPLGRDDLAGHARLAARIGTPLCLDEALDSPERVTAALETGACSVVCVKPARLGGVGPTLAALAAADHHGAPAWMGGMFEAGFGRGVLTTLAALCDRWWPGDLSPPSTYLDDDVAPEPALERDPQTGFLCAVAAPPGSIGLAPPPDRTALERVATARVVEVRP